MELKTKSQNEIVTSEYIQESDDFRYEFSVTKNNNSVVSIKMELFKDAVSVGEEDEDGIKSESIQANAFSFGQIALVNGNKYIHLPDSEAADKHMTVFNEFVKYIADENN